jgi:hypothetical protein
MHPAPEVGADSAVPEAVSSLTTGLTVSTVAMNSDSDSITINEVSLISQANENDPYQETEHENECDIGDPCAYSGRRLKRHDITVCLAKGPCQPLDYKFPMTDGRSFQAEWFNSIMPDGTIHQRSWLSYSKTTDKTYCIPCILFSGPRGSDTWTTSGFNNWHNGARDIQRHEVTVEHREAEIAKIQWTRGMAVDVLLDRNRSAIVDENRKVLQCVLDCVKYLATEMIAFRGKDAMSGKFINLFRTVAKRDPSAAAYLIKVDEAHRTKKKMAGYLINSGNVKLVVKTLKEMIVEQILLRIKEQRKVCLIFDSTQDFSKKEASVLLVRYLELDANGTLHPVERLLEVLTSGETSGAALKQEVLAVLQQLKFDMAWIIVQCYDGAGNMRGRYAGLATLIQNDCNKAVYIWCNAHRLNLVMNAVMCSYEVKKRLVF